MIWNSMKHNFLSTKQFYINSQRLIPIFAITFFLLISIGVYGGLILAPADYQQGDGFRIIYVHVPAAFTAMSIYFIMAVSAAISLIWRVKVASICMSSSARIGIWFTLLALITGALWGKPMWGTYWVWDARLTSVLILLFLYLGFITLQSIIQNSNSAERAPAVLAIAGSINLPIIHYSVIWWNTLHQGPSLSQFKIPTIAPSMLWPLLIMIIAFQLFYLWILFIRMSNQIYLFENNKNWMKKVYLNAST